MRATECCVDRYALAIHNDELALFVLFYHRDQNLLHDFYDTGPEWDNVFPKPNYAKEEDLRKPSQEGLFIKGRIDFDFIDVFADPIDLGNLIEEDYEDPDGTPYDITDKWYGTYEALVHSDETKSVYKSIPS